MPGATFQAYLWRRRVPPDAPLHCCGERKGNLNSNNRRAGTA